MAITVEEKFGRLLSDNSAELTYIVRGTTSDADARLALLANAPTSHDGLSRDDAEVEEIAPGSWLGVVRYASADQLPPEVGESSYSFETRGGTQHITQSLQTIASYAPTGVTAPDFKGAIGVQGDGIEGVDITVPVFTFSETHPLDDATVTTAYKSTLFYLTGKTNNAAFKGLAAGEALFLGAAGTKRDSSGVWEISFAFAGSPNVTGLTVGEITGIAKKGFEYLWIRYQEAEDATAKMLIKKPIAAYVEKVYREGDFSQLGIGT
jgi:hypothetical protein